MRSRRVLRAVALFATASVGLLAAHELDYRLVVPDPAHRHDLLFRTGHGYLQHAFMFVLVAGLLAVLTAVTLGVSRRTTRARPLRVTATRLALIQSGGFVLLEAVERILVGAPQDDRLLAVTALGVAVQALTALAGATALSFLERAARTIAAVVRARPTAGAIAAAPAVPVERHPLAPRARFAGSFGVRGPPLLAGS